MLCDSICADETRTLEPTLGKLTHKTFHLVPVARHPHTAEILGDALEAAPLVPAKHVAEEPRLLVEARRTTVLEPKRELVPAEVPLIEAAGGVPSLRPRRVGRDDALVIVDFDLAEPF